MNAHAKPLTGEKNSGEKNCNGVWVAHGLKVSKIGKQSQAQARGAFESGGRSKLSRSHAPRGNQWTVFWSAGIPVPEHKISRSHGLRGNASGDAPRPVPQSGTASIPTRSMGTM